jgi:hypothetical protein
MRRARTLRPPLLTALLLFAGASVWTSAASLAPPHVYLKDFIQEYLLGKAALGGVNPYLPLPVLARHFISPPPVIALDHPTPHPPPVALLSLPLALLSYERAAAVWFVFEVVCVFAAARLLVGGLASPSWAKTLSGGALLLCWHPFWEELGMGQINTLLLVLLAAAWRDLRAGRDVRGGVWLGLMLALKMMAWPLAVYLLLERRWRAAAAVAATAAAAYGGAALLVGAGHFADYFRQVGGVAALYRHNGGNISFWSFGYRLFEGTRGEVEVLPFFYSPALARLTSFALPAAALAVALVAARRAAEFDTAFALLGGVSLLVNPVAWTHYLVLAALPLAVAARRLFTPDRSRPQVYLAALTALLLLVSRLNADHFLRQFAFRPAASPQVLTVAALPGLLTLIPVAGLLSLLWLVWRSESSPRATARGERLPSGGR